MDMFCFQCEQTARGKGCDYLGNCGKEPEVAALQDLIIHQAKGIGYLAHQARRMGRVDDEVNRYTLEALFTTVTNVNFDPERLVQWIRRAARCGTGSWRSAARQPAARRSRSKRSSCRIRAVPTRGIARRAAPSGTAVGLRADKAEEDIRSLKQLLLYGLKGMAAYAEHAYLLGKQDDLIFAFIHEALAASERPRRDHEPPSGAVACAAARSISAAWRSWTRRTPGDSATPCRPRCATSLKKGPAIIVTGHDLLDLEALLKQTEGKGINVYTHGEMLPAHGYPGLKKYAHLVGHFGRRWQNQQEEFEQSPRRHSVHDQLHPAAAGQLQGPHLHHRPGGLARRRACRESRLHAGHREGPRRCRASSRPRT